MKNRSGEKIKLASIDELLGVVNEESAMEIEISKIHPFLSLNHKSVCFTLPLLNKNRALIPQHYYKIFFLST